MTRESLTQQAWNTTLNVEDGPCIEEHFYEPGGASYQARLLHWQTRLIHHPPLPRELARISKSAAGNISS
jgi:hypothetical protein